MLRISIVCTSKPMGKTEEEYCIFGEEEAYVTDKDEARDYLRNRYGTCKREKMYVKEKNETKQVGWIYCFRGDDMSHYPVNRWYQQDWVTVYEVLDKPILV